MKTFGRCFSPQQKKKISAMLDGELVLHPETRISNFRILIL
jgi:hypothetical protein